MSESTPVQDIGLMACCNVTNTSPWPYGDIERLLLTNRIWLIRGIGKKYARWLAT